MIDQASSRCRIFAAINSDLPPERNINLFARILLSLIWGKTWQMTIHMSYFVDYVKVPSVFR